MLEQRSYSRVCGHGKNLRTARRWPFVQVGSLALRSLAPWLFGFRGPLVTRHSGPLALWLVTWPVGPLDLGPLARWSRGHLLPCPFSPSALLMTWPFWSFGRLLRSFGPLTRRSLSLYSRALGSCGLSAPIALWFCVLLTRWSIGPLVDWGLSVH